MSDKKYPGYNANDTSWDQFQKERGMMTNREFFTSSAKEGFYEGMEWDGEEWVPNAETRARQDKIDSQKCPECDCNPCYCY